jgi:hypothetical protein
MTLVVFGSCEATPKHNETSYKLVTLARATQKKVFIPAMQVEKIGRSTGKTERQAHLFFHKMGRVC